MNFSVHSFGCRLNQAETLYWIKELKKRGHKYVKEIEKSDFHIVNTCTLTERADRDVKKYIRTFRIKFPNIKLILTGCFVEHYKNELLSEEKILYFPNKEKEKILEFIDSFGRKEDKLLKKKDYRVRAFLKINDGCNFNCSYCIIPHVRGRAKRRDKEEIKKDFIEFLSSGYKEIVLTGINITYYGYEKKPNTSLKELIEELLKIEGDYIIRLTSLDPRFTDEELQKLLILEERIAPHFHVSIQHGSEKILNDMNRPYRINKYMSLLEELSKREKALLSADYIVGFPTERDSDFKEGFKFLKESPLNYIHIFPFSPRPGTPASLMKQLQSSIIKEREMILREFHKKRYTEFKKRFVGESLMGIAVSKNRVLTENYIYADLFSPLDKNGELVKLKISKVLEDGVVIGEVFK